MRVRMREASRVYWSYAVKELAQDEEFDGELARYLVEIGEPVDIVDGELPAPPAPVLATEEPDTSPPTELLAERAPVDGTIDDLMTWIDGDKDRAAAALAAEQAKDSPRRTVIKRLTP